MVHKSVTRIADLIAILFVGAVALFAWLRSG